MKETKIHIIIEKTDEVTPPSNSSRESDIPLEVLQTKDIINHVATSKEEASDFITKHG